jgi:hypothetical protein
LATLRRIGNPPGPDTIRPQDFNHFNPAGHDGVLASNQFGQATSVNTGFGGGGFGGGGMQMGSTANNRRIDLGLRFNF